jgi:hypothetical protein
MRPDAIASLDLAQMICLIGYRMLNQVQFALQYILIENDEHLLLPFGSDFPFSEGDVLLQDLEENESIRFGQHCLESCNLTHASSLASLLTIPNNAGPLNLLLNPSPQHLSLANTPNNPPRPATKPQRPPIRLTFVYLPQLRESNALSFCILVHCS